ncbi:outer membrane lipoprotein carrier protein LolA [Dickeya dianthicola]|uniref:Outer membrane lipoprotein carrier protein LolA n=1 Tax=Dickeya dianthicola TaxID=204039 RepID=A0AAX1C4B2_9GAMM|nr:outer membrane lipoprotein carrier protein LolA [Dickeya dianthicola]MBT1434168.1 outer membrane lipoprotein carrier protein LolA [Dickeya dianthicola]MCA7003982.1 outer membrane lipoprotein carrier protein LolA [Dickeya dianthicola]MCI4002771.1 outer membrane lipoprotein carrier protein LolA [Dickeya dianthicola]MCI4155818.1 outer membrane lipoprotein carrier protein LolA [Dickeya dianthicola]MCI4203005.1 outer membrane lipoprotein carrier protein LolA [Dickeya dianthicola]
MLRPIFLVVMALLSLTAQAVTLDELQQRFSSQPVVRADFTQMRQIKGMAQPLKSSGAMLIARQNGLWWHQAKPFPMTLVLDDQRMVQVMNGQPPQIITAESQPQMFQFNHLLRALFQADRRVLEQNFRVDFNDLGQQRWRLVLTPKVSPLDKLFNAITLNGQAFLDEIVIDDRQGDMTRITLSNQRITPQALSDDEQTRFVF